jgi:hypothetical protein
MQITYPDIYLQLLQADAISLDEAVTQISDYVRGEDYTTY